MELITLRTFYNPSKTGKEKTTKTLRGSTFLLRVEKSSQFLEKWEGILKSIREESRKLNTFGKDGQRYDPSQTRQPFQSMQNCKIVSTPKRWSSL